MAGQEIANLGRQLWNKAENGTLDVTTCKALAVELVRLGELVEAMEVMSCSAGVGATTEADVANGKVVVLNKFRNQPGGSKGAQP